MADVSIDSGNITKIRTKETTTPATPASGYAYIYTKTDGIYHMDDAGTETGPFVIPEYPVRAFWLHGDSEILNGNGLTHSVGTQVLYTIWYQSAPADADQFGYSAVLSAGDYTISLYGYSNSASGKLDVEFKHKDDGSWTSITTGLDWYSPGATYNVNKTGTFSVVTSGRQLFRFTVNGKNASSSNYSIFLTRFSVYLTAGDS